MKKIKTKCKVCGCEFVPKKKKVYTVVAPRGPFEFMKPAAYFSAIDCPHCGCQKLLAPRDMRCDFPEYEEEYEEETEGKSEDEQTTSR